MAFRDVIDIVVKAGKGGDGGLSMMRLKYVPKGGPDGGNGGNGGSIYLESITDVTSLDRLIGKRSFKAGTGQQGEGRDKNGRTGSDLTIYVPVGTMAYDLDTGELMADLIEVGQRACVAKGGLGGRGNASFTNSHRQAPRFAEYGTLGEKRNIRLELRSIADVGLVGYPNAGKSSLLAALSNAKPEIASYPFTTLSPNLGVVNHDKHGLKRLTLADIPGIIEGASEGKGLGLDFLRHISRTRLLVYVLDISEDVKATLSALQKELRDYDDTLLSLPSMIVINKIDMAEPNDIQEAIDTVTSFGLPTLAVSVLERENLDVLVDNLFALLPERKAMAALEARAVHVKVDPISVSRHISGNGWTVSGEAIESVINRFDTTNLEAVSYLHHHFLSLGVNKMLKKAGAQDGDDVFIGDAVFEYFDEEKAKAAQRAEERAAQEALAGAKEKYKANDDDLADTTENDALEGDDNEAFS